VAKKPILKSTKIKFYNFDDLVKLVDQELGCDQRDCGKFFYPESLSFDEWHKIKKYPKKDKEGKYKGSSQIWYSEYQQEVNSGIIEETPYCDFWHKQLDSCFLDDVSNDSYNQLYVGLDDEVTQFAEDSWELYIQKIYNKLFKKMANKDGYVSVRISW
jgi:hypothetical protein